MPPSVARDAVEMSTGNHSPWGFEHPVQLVEHEAGLDPAAPVLDVELEQAVHVARAVDDEPAVDGLAALRGAAAAAGDRHAELARGGQARAHVVGVARAGDRERHHLVDRRVGRVAAALERVGGDVAAQLGAQPPGELGRERGGRAGSHGRSRSGGGGVRALVGLYAGDGAPDRRARDC